MIKNLEHHKVDENYQNTYSYQEFLLHIGIDPQDFNDEFDIEMDDYSN
jgi:hypothetical protein